MKVNYYYIDSNKTPCYFERFRKSLIEQIPDIVIVSTREELLDCIKKNLGYQVVITDESPYIEMSADLDLNWAKNLEQLSQKVDVIFSLSAEMFKSVVLDIYPNIVKNCSNVYLLASRIFSIIQLISLNDSLLLIYSTIKSYSGKY